MANKNINILISLQDKFSKPLKGTVEETKRAQKQIKACSNVINGWAGNATAKFNKVMGTAGKIGAAFLTLGGVISAAGVKAWASEAISGFNAANQAETKLEAVLKNVPSIIALGADEAGRAKDRLVSLADEMENTGVIAGDISVAGMQQLATFQLTEESLAQLAPGMADLVAQQKGLNATQGDAVSVANLVGKAMTGQTGALSKCGIIMTGYQEKVMKTGSEQQRAAMMAEILQQNVGGVNRALAQTDAGKILQAQNILGRASDEIGGKLMNIKAQVFSLAAKYIPDIQAAAMGFLNAAGPKIEAGMQYIEEHSAQIKAAIGGVRTVVGAAFAVLQKGVGWATANFKILAPILGAVVGYFTAFQVVTSIASALSVLTTVIQGVSAAGGVLNVILAANPLILIAMAIAAVIAAGIALYQNWDVVKAKALELWEKVKAVFGGIRDSITGAFTGAKESVLGVVDWIADKIGAIGAAIEKVPVLGDIFRGIKGFAATFGDQAAPAHATGTSYFAGGATRINEGGRGEIVDLPSGTRIVPHDVAVKAASGAPSVSISITVQGNVIGNREFMEETGEYVTNKVIAALGTV